MTSATLLEAPPPSPHLNESPLQTRGVTGAPYTTLVPISINSWYLQPYWTLQHTSEQTKPQRNICSVHRHMSCCLYNRGVCNSKIRNDKVDCNKYGKIKL